MWGSVETQSLHLHFAPVYKTLLDKMPHMERIGSEESVCMVEILHFLFCESILQGSHIFYIRHEYYIAANPCMPRDCIREVSRLWIAASLAVLKLRSIKHKSSYTLFSFQSILIPRSDEYKKSLQQQRSFYHFGKLCSNAPQFLSSLIFIFRDGQVSCLDLFSFPL